MLGDVVDMYLVRGSISRSGSSSSSSSSRSSSSVIVIEEDVVVIVVVMVIIVVVVVPHATSSSSLMSPGCSLPNTGLFPLPKSFMNSSFSLAWKGRTGL